MKIVHCVLFRDEVLGKLSVHPTVCVAMTSPQSITDGPASVYFEKRLVCECSSLLRAVVTMFSLYYVFDVRFPAGLGNAMNFRDLFIAGIDQKSKIRPAVQRRINNLHAD